MRNRRSRWSWTVVWGILFAFAVLLACAGAATSATVQSQSNGVFRWRPFLGPFHSLVLHYPIGFLTMAFILELYRLWRPSEEARRITTLVIALSLIASVVAASLGIMRAGGGGYEGRTVEVHRLFGMAVPFLTLATMLLHLGSSRKPAAFWLYGYRAMLVCALGALVAAGHYGGNLSHGSKYLVQNAPEFIKDLIEPELPAAAAPGHRQQFFLEKVQPVFEAKCIACHGPEKQKGDYRIDDSALAAKGGSSGETAIKPGEPMASEIVRRIMLPRDDDEAMPPDGKEQLTAEEVMDIVHWIQDGATFVGPTVGGPVSAGVEQ